MPGGPGSKKMHSLQSALLEDETARWQVLHEVASTLMSWLLRIVSRCHCYPTAFNMELIHHPPTLDEPTTHCVYTAPLLPYLSYTSLRTQTAAVPAVLKKGLYYLQIMSAPTQLSPSTPHPVPRFDRPRLPLRSTETVSDRVWDIYVPKDRCRRTTRQQRRLV